MKNSILKLECVDITVDFYGVCKYEGLVVFVKGLIPGEVANVKIIKVNKNIAYGIIVDIINASKYRVKEKCSIFSKCGGCDIQYIDYEYQLQLKRKLVENTAKKFNYEVNIIDAIPSNNAYEYRNKIQVPVADNKIGYYRNHSNDIVEFDRCCITSGIFNDILQDIKAYILKYSLSNYLRHIVLRNASEGVMVCFVAYDFELPYLDEIVKLLTNKYKCIKSIMVNKNTKDTNVIFGDNDKCIYGEEYIIDKCNDLSFAIPLRSFYQINSEQMKKLYDLVITKACLSKKDKVLDLFCGIGTISLYISNYVEKVLGIEINDKSVEYANKNKLLNSIDNVEFIKADANDINDYIKGYNVVILDPPRKGVASDLISSIINSDINTIIYISCNQATLLRDLQLFGQTFKTNEIQLIDMFPNTKHIESITILKRQDI